MSKGVHGNIKFGMNNFRKVDGCWQRKLLSGGGWKTLHVEETVGKVHQNETGGTWTTHVPHIWTWR
jgi:hypothetical protein